MRITNLTTFIYLIIHQLLCGAWLKPARHQLTVDLYQKDSEKENHSSKKLLRNSVNPCLNLDMSLTYDWLPVSDADSLSDLYLLITEILLRLPYAVLKLCRITIKGGVSFGMFGINANNQR